MVIDVVLNPKIAVSRMDGGGKTVSQAPELVKNFEKKVILLGLIFLQMNLQPFKIIKQTVSRPGSGGKTVSRRHQHDALPVDLSVTQSL